MYIKLEDVEKYLLQICTPESARMRGLKAFPTINPVEVLEGMIEKAPQEWRQPKARHMQEALEEAIEKLKQ